MGTISAELTFNQLGAAVQRLPYGQKVALWQLLGAEVDRQDSLRRQARQEFAEAVRLIRAANRGVSEDEIMADVDAAVLEVRAARRATYCG
jgi:hypothetical protein